MSKNTRTAMITTAAAAMICIVFLPFPLLFAGVGVGVDFGAEAGFGVGFGFGSAFASAFGSAFGSAFASAFTSVFASSFTAMDTEINTCLTAEARVICGKPMFVPYKLMGTPELAACVADNSVLADVLLLENHGIITFGNSLLNAFGKLEVLENAAKMTLITKMTGNIREMSSSQVQEIDRLYGHRKKITQT